MGSIVSTGVGSGLDVAGLVDKLVKAEGQPKSTRLDSQEAKAQAKISALGTLRSSLAKFRDSVATLKNLESFRGRQVTLTSPDFVAASATATAVPGTYSVEVQQLAQAHKLQSITYGSADTLIGTGTLTIATGGLTFDVAIDAEHNSVAKIAAAINESSAGTKVVATVISGANGTARLTLTSRASGAANAMTITQSGGDGGLAALTSPPAVGGLTEVQQARDAKALIDGFQVQSATNSIAGAIAGVEINVVAPNEVGETTAITIGFDKDGASEAVNGLVNSYNSVLDAIKSVASYDPETKVGGPLFGDAGVRNLGYQMRRELTSAVAGASSTYDMLNEIGVTAGLDGKLEVNTGKLDSALAADFDGVGSMFSATNTGLAVKLDKLLEPYLQTGGVFDSRNASLKTSIDDISQQRVALNARLTVLQDRYLKQFNALDGLLSQLQSTSSFLSQQLGQLPGTLFNKN